MRGIAPETVWAAAERQLRQAGLPPAMRRDEHAEPAPVVYLDRDGTLNLDPGYLNNPEGMRLLPGVGSAIARLNRAGFKTVLVTNQSGVGRGLIRAEALDAIHRRLRDLLAESGAWLDGIYACPHRPEEACGCRKPASGLVTRARQELALSSERSFVIGDRAIDMELARNIGARGVFVLSGDRPNEERALMAAVGITPDYVARFLGDAVDWVLQSCLVPCAGGSEHHA
jgi:histidinol-phosphate phosphatase family protein